MEIKLTERQIVISALKTILSEQEKIPRVPRRTDVVLWVLKVMSEVIPMSSSEIKKGIKALVHEVIDPRFDKIDADFKKVTTKIDGMDKKLDKLLAMPPAKP